MVKNDIFSKEIIKMKLKAKTKEDAINELSDLLVENDYVSKKSEFVEAVLKRESEFPTELENSAAIPHGKSNSVIEAAVAIGVSEEGIQFGEDPKRKTHIIFLIAMPKDANNEHIQTLARVTSKLLDTENVKNMIESKTKTELLERLQSEDIKEIKEIKEDGKFFIGVTGCPVGVAHTYLAAKSLQKAAQEMGHTIKVETNGSIGVENSPTDEEIERAEGIIVACDKEIDKSRFDGKKVVFTGVKAGIDKPKELIEEVLTGKAKVYKSSEKKKSSNKKEEKGLIYKALMNGVSFMIPFVVIGGLMIAISLALGGEPTPAGLVIPEGSMWNHVLAIGDVGFKLMVPILAGYIAYALGDRPALAPGMVGGWIANNGSFYGAEAGTGFIGAIIAGFLVGYFVKAIKKIKFPNSIQPLVPIMIIPILASLFIGGIFIFIIGAPISSLMEWLFNTLENMSSGSMIAIGIVIGLMQGFDMGGPFGKVAFMFSVGLIAEGQTQFMGAQAVAIPVAPLGMALATFIDRKRKYFTEEEKANGKAAFAMGLVGISEGAIPFAAASPFAAIPANMIGSAVACVLGFLFGITNSVAHGGPIVVLLGVVNKPMLAILAMLIGTIVTATLTLVIKEVMMRKK